MKYLLSLSFFAFLFWGITSAQTSEATKIYSLPSSYLTELDKLPDDQKIEIRNYRHTLELFDELDYTPEEWQAGIREIPRVYLVVVGERWGNETTKKITTLLKKRLFFRGLAPLILHSNELILKDRTHLENIIATKRTGTFSEADKEWVKKAAQLYKVKDDNPLSDESLNELLKRVDIIPASLALAQAAAESGWGTSRFAEEGNSIYGQWSWGKDAIVPEEQRTHLGNYGIAAFETIQQSVSGYMLNLNSHYAYEKLREIRAEMRSKGKRISGYDLAAGLIRYSERGETYIETMRSIIDYNHLRPTDDAYFSDDKPIYLIPVEDE